MSIVILGKGWHVESTVISVTIEDAAGTYDTDFALEKPGAFLAGVATPTEFTTNDNIHAIGIISLARATPSATQLTIGQNCTGMRVRIIKGAGTAGSTGVVIVATVVIRDSSV